MFVHIISIYLCIQTEELHAALIIIITKGVTGVQKGLNNNNKPGGSPTAPTAVWNLIHCHSLTCSREYYY